MKRRAKDVDYDSLPFLTVAGYLSRPLDQPGKIGKRICELMLDHLGNHRVRIDGLWDLDKLIHEDHKDYLQNVIGRYEAIVERMKVHQGTMFVLGTGMPRYWSYFYKDEVSVPKEQGRHSIIKVHMYMDLFEHLNEGAGQGKWLAFISDIIRGIDNDAMYYGLVHADIARNLDFGYYYGDQVPDKMTWREAVEHVDWFSSGESRMHRMRAPTWGTYLGAAQVAKLDGSAKGSFLRRYLEPRGADPSHAGIELLSGAVFVTTSNNPMEAVELPLRRHHDPVVENAVWLWQEFRKVGMV